MRHRWIVVGVLVIAALSATTSWAVASNSAPRVSYPAACQRVVACVDNHLNNLDARMHRQHDVILALRAKVASDSSLLASVAGQVNCYQVVQVSEYPAAASSWHPLDNLLPGTDQTEGGTYLDFTHNNNPANNGFWKFIYSNC